VSLLLHLAFQNRKQHLIGFDQLQPRAIWRTQLKGRDSEVPFSELASASRIKESPKAIGPAEEILNRHEVIGSDCAGQNHRSRFKSKFPPIY
jgi:hypothetical protein